MKVEPLASRKRAAEILLVEDNYGDALLTKKAFAGAEFDHTITVAGDGIQALGMLRGDEGFPQITMPDLVLLDLNLPKKSGKEVLDEIKKDDRLKHIPVVVLTSSAAELDVVRSYTLHANSYIIKPVSLVKFIEVAKTLKDFWFATAVLPDSQTAAKE